VASPGRYSPIDRAQLIELYVDRGLTIDQVGAKMGVSGFTGHKRMVEHGIPTRSRLGDLKPASL
jgi:hypothetical protein